jgi:hypothetical protein
VSHPFVVESRSASTIEIRHIIDGHRYTFHVSNAPGRRIFEEPMFRKGVRATLNSTFHADEARRFAEREGRIANIID